MLHSEYKLSFLGSQAEECFQHFKTAPSITSVSEQAPFRFFLFESVPSVPALLSEFSKESIETTVLKLLDFVKK